MPHYIIKGIRTEYTTDRVYADNKQDAVKKLKSEYGLKFEVIKVEENES